MNNRTCFLPITIAAFALAAAINPATAMVRMDGPATVVPASNVVMVAKKKSSTQQEADKSVKSGTVPAKYRSSVPQQYQQYVPFAPSPAAGAKGKARPPAQ